MLPHLIVTLKLGVYFTTSRTAAAGCAAEARRLNLVTLNICQLVYLKQPTFF